MENREQLMPTSTQASFRRTPAPSRIEVLDDSVINKIAAGEVVERPASVLKELIENSIDSGARNIEIEAHSGGIQSILVRDDGCGIRKVEIELALSRHATSKLNQFDDIEGIRTMGFRGEALPSIASVSRVSLSTRTVEDSHGWNVRCEDGGKISEPQPVRHELGTTVEIRDLFFNVPARRKFLRTESTEFSYLDRLVKQMALARTDISFIFVHNKNRATRFQAVSDDTSIRTRLASVLGDDFADTCIRVELTWDEIKISGWVSTPDQTRSQPDRQYLFVNGRCIQDRRIMHAIRQAYVDVLYDSSRYPLCVLYLEVDPKSVDVNVHPTKSQVRFRRQNEVYRSLLRAVSGALRGERPGTRQTTTAEISVSPQPHTHKSFQSSLQGAFSLPINSNWTDLSEQLPGTVYSSPSGTDSASDADIPPLGFALAQLGGAYILAENTQGLVIIDMHASHERITYEQLKKDFENSKLKSQELIVPIIVKVTSQEADAAMTNSKTLAGLGFDVSLSGENVICVRSVPEFLGNTDIEQIVRDIIADLIEHENSNRVEHLRNEILASISCHTAIRANHQLSIPQMNGLLRQMEATENSGYCSHGRPTWKQFSIEELDKLFYRGR